MPDSSTSERESGFVCGCERSMRSACAGEPFYKEHEGKRYCVLHFPDKKSSAAFEKALRRKLENKDFNFRGVWFPEGVSFSDFEFDTKVDFSSATFSALAGFRSATFSDEADFSEATFSADADFGSATFVVANFRSATFAAEAYFRHAMFGAEATFISATFSADAVFSFATFSMDAYFGWATFSAEVSFLSVTFSANVSFRSAAFADHVSFAATKSRSVFTDTSSLNLEFARSEKPDHVSFHTLTLHPHWFINIDARRFDFINVHWNNSGKAKPELELLKSKGFASPHRLLAIACRKLAANSEESDRYREASDFRRMAMDAERLETWRGFDLRKLNWWYWLASGYGERISRAFLVLLGIWFFAGFLYTRVGFVRWEPRLASEADVMISMRDDVGAPLSFKRAITYSLGVMTLQRPEPRPATFAAQTVVLFETILGPVQAALLALAIRRKFMR